MSINVILRAAAHNTLWAYEYLRLVVEATVFSPSYHKQHCRCEEHRFAAPNITATGSISGRYVTGGKEHT
jgi:hypothetical protein